uniref:Uncharacterized protein n=1 Tax=Oryza sativa subsp. japonica TaxID=39947 RepID=Q6Z2R8_ORYSJ|nr:hypothetical protein [Oryza sativa Japonica Group]
MAAYENSNRGSWRLSTRKEAAAAEEMEELTAVRVHKDEEEPAAVGGSARKEAAAASNGGNVQGGELTAVRTALPPSSQIWRWPLPTLPDLDGRGDNGGDAPILSFPSS